MKITRKLATLLLGIMITVISAEMILYAYSYLRFDHSMVYLPNIKTGRNPNPEFLNGISGPSNFTTNSVGLRGPEPKKNALFGVAIGNSTTQNVWLDDTETWPQLVMDKINADCQQKVVINSAGHGGLVARHAVLTLEALIKQNHKPDFIFWMPGGPDASMLLRQAPDYVGLKKEHEARAFATAVTRWNRFPRDFKMSLLHQYYEQIETRFGKSIKRLFGKTVSNKRDGHKLAREIRTINETSLEYWQQLPPDVAKCQKQAINDFLKKTRTIIALCKKENITLYALIQPTVWRKNMPPENQKVCSDPIFQKKKMRLQMYDQQMMQHYREVLIEESERAGFAVIDLNRHFQSQDDCFIDNIHFNEKGSKVAANCIFKVLAKDFEPNAEH
jgi:lysophospholipase L1-like esterase